MGQQLACNRNVRYAISAILCIFALLLVTTCAFASKAYALKDDQGNKVKTPVVVSFLKGGDNYFDYYDGNKKITNIKSTNEKVLVASEGWSRGSFSIQVKKAGNAKVKYKQKGVKKSIKFKVVKYKNPVKHLKIGSKDYAASFKKSRTASAKNGQTKVSVTPASGWKVKGIFAGGDEKIANNSNLSSKSWEIVWVYLANSKTGAVEKLTLYASNWTDE